MQIIDDNCRCIVQRRGYSSIMGQEGSVEGMWKVWDGRGMAAFVSWRVWLPKILKYKHVKSIRIVPFSILEFSTTKTKQSNSSCQNDPVNQLRIFPQKKHGFSMSFRTFDPGYTRVKKKTVLLRTIRKISRHRLLPTRGEEMMPSLRNRT